MSNMNKTLKDFDLEPETLEILKNNNVDTVGDLWKQKRTGLKEMGLGNDEINHIIIKMQLYGIDLNKRTYEKE